MSRRQSARDISYTLAIGGLASLALVILLGPVLVVLITSFTDNRWLKFPPTGLPLQWYAELFHATRSRQIHACAQQGQLGANARHGLHVANDPSRPRLRIGGVDVFHLL